MKIHRTSYKWIILTSILLVSSFCANPLWAQSTKDEDDQQLFIGDSIAIAQTEYGQVKGYIINNVYAFRGIPYGDTTEKRNRFMPPQPPKPWDGIRPMVMWGASAPQEGPQWETVFNYHAWQDSWKFYGINEDCLNLNVWTQGIADGKKRPVLVWLHGGSWVTGNSIEMDSYQGENITRYGDIVFVSINHRLGPFGLINFASVDNRFKESGNVSVLDMIAALKWVHNNIKNFGGDPDNITIMGQSGGGSKVCTLIAMPEIKGLVHKGVALSGSASNAGNAEAAANFGKYIVAQTGKTVDELQQMNWNEFNRIAYELTDKYNEEQRIKNQPSLGYHPIADGQHIPEGQFYQDKTAAGNCIPMLFCSTTGEWSVTKYSQATEDIDKEGAIRKVATRYGDRARKLVEEYHKVFPERKWGELIGIIGWNSRGNIINAINAKTAVQEAPCYLAWFDWHSPLFDGRAHAFHTIDICFWLRNTDLMLTHTGGGKRPRDLSKKMADALLSFMRTGNPNHPGIPEWKPYNPKDGWTMMLSDECILVKDLDKEARKAFK